MVEYYAGLAGNLEAFLWYFFADDPNTTNRFRVATVDGQPVIYRYDKDAYGEYLTGTIQLSTSGGTWNSGGLTGGTVTGLKFWIGRVGEYEAGEMTGGAYDAVTLEVFFDAAKSGDDVDIALLSYHLGAPVEMIHGTADADEIYHSSITPLAQVDLAEGDDTMFAGLEDVVAGLFDGGDGVDTLQLEVYYTGPGTNIIDLRSGTFMDAWGNVHDFRNFETVIGSAIGDVIYGGDFDQSVTTLSGGDGGDTLYVGPGLVSLYFGGDGEDTVVAGLHEAGSTTMKGGRGYDRLVIGFEDAGPGQNVIDLHNSNFTDLWGTSHSFDDFSFVQGSDLDDIFLGPDTYTDVKEVNGGRGDDHMFAGDWTDFYDGGAGNDTIEGLFGNDARGGDGDDLITAINGAAVFGGEGNDTYDLGGAYSSLSYVEVSGTGLPGIEARLSEGKILWNGGIDTILHGSQFFYGSAGDDTIVGAALFGIIDGGDGDDEFHISEFQPDNQPIRIRGGNGDDRFVITKSDHIIEGGFGSDTFIVEGTEGGRASLSGGPDGDIYELSTFDVSITEYTDGTDTDILRFVEPIANPDPWTNGATSISFIGIERVEGSFGDDSLLLQARFASPHVTPLRQEILLGAGNDKLYLGTSDSVSVFGGEGDDDLRAFYRADNIFDGGAGADRMDASKGSDIYIVDNPLDVIADTGSDDLIDTVLVQGADSFDFTGVDWTGVERIMSEDPLVALDGRTYAGDATLFGSGGTDTILGGKAGSEIHGGKGGDILIGDGGLADLEEYMPDLYAELPPF